MSARIGVVAAAPAVDRTHLVTELRPGTIHRPSRVLALPGGKGLNVAHVLRTLGADVVVAAPLAGATGRWLAEQAAASGLDVRPTWIPGELRTCVSVFAEADGSLTEFYEPPLPVAPADWARFVADAVAAMSAGGAGAGGAATLAAVAVSGKVPAGCPPDGLAAIVRALGATGLLVAVDADGPGLRDAIAARPAIVKVNGVEAGSLLGRDVRTAAEAITAAAELRASGPSAAVVTLGRDGAVAVDAGGAAWRVHPIVADGRFPTGSGDAFLAGLLAALTAGATFPDALRLATGAAAANTEQPGAGIVDPARARAIAATVRVEATQP
jgi:1-phosphofructokinase family hexose kinase